MDTSRPATSATPRPGHHVDGRPADAPPDETPASIAPPDGTPPSHAPPDDTLPANVPAESPLKPGRAARAVVARARALLVDLDALSALAPARRGDVHRQLETLRRRLAQDQLATIPVTDLRSAAGAGVRLNALATAGYRTVADLLDTDAHRLRTLPGVGEHTAEQAVAAARELAHTVESDVTVRLDPDRRDDAQTQLLRSLRAYVRAAEQTAPLADDIAAFVQQATPLVDPATRAGSRLRLLFAGRARSQARAALAELDRLLTRPSTTALVHALEAARTALAQPPPSDAELWREFETDAAAVYAVLGQLGDDRADVDATQGFVPTEIADDANEIRLNTSMLRVSLRGYQAFGAKFALAQRRTILGDEMGLGKTIEALAAIAHLHARGATHSLVVCPASVLANWMHEISARTTLAVHRAHGPDKHRDLGAWGREGGVAVTTYATLRSLHPPDGMDLAMLVADEAHYVKNPDAKRTQAIRSWITCADHTLFLTGTPMENRVDEFKNLVGYLQPQVADSISSLDGLAGATAFRRAVAPAYLRRNQVDVLAELPEKLEADDWVDLGTADGAAYRRAVASGNFMAMRRAAFATPSPDGSSKVARLLEIVDESAASGWKVVVFSYFRDVLTVVEEAIGAAVVGQLNGDVAPADRQRLIDEFSAVDGHAVLVCQIETGGVGLNLQAASVVVLTEPQWKPSTESQAIARCHRMGQVRRVHVHRLLAEDTVDEHMLRVQAGKALLFDDYARQSAAKDANPEAVDAGEMIADRPPPGQTAAEREIVHLERERLGLASASA